MPALIGRSCKILLLAAACATLCACATQGPTPIADRVHVEFVGPEGFTDFAAQYGAEPSAYAAALRAHVVRRAAPLLREGQTLKIAILDVDRAGRAEPWHPSFYGRVVRNIDPAQIALRFVLTGPDGSVLKAGPRALTNPYLLVPPTAYPSDPLRHEKFLIEDWLERELS